MASGECCIERGPLGERAVAVAAAELREEPERVREATLRLRELLAAEQDLHFRDDDDFLLIFLRPCKFYPESALKLMRRVAEFKKANADLLEGLMPEDEKDALLNYDLVNIIKGRDHKGRRFLIVRAGGIWDPKKVNSNQIFRIFYLIHLAAILEVETQVNGVVVIMDFEDMGMKQVAGLTPSFAMRLLTFIQDAMPLRLKEVHFVKEPWIFKFVWQIFKPLVKAKLRARMYFHKSDMASLHKHLEPSYLPSNYGGELPAMDYTLATWYPSILDHLDHIRNWNSYGLVSKPEEAPSK